jgi:hypothetical protein
MNTLTTWACAAGLVFAWSALAGMNSGKQPPASATKVEGQGNGAKAPGVAVVEVFTSEGCSSCPPADDLAARIARESAAKGANVFVLAMHVDYWDYLGWKDPFARGEFSTRQRTYANALGKAGGDGGIYTPEMIVNGAVAFVGSNSARATQAIDDALREPARAKIEAAIALRKAGERIKVEANITGQTMDEHACAAVFEDGLSVEVKSGENIGKTLRHDRVVRAFAERPIKDGKAMFDLQLPEGVKEDHCRVVAFVQGDKLPRVSGATEVPLMKNSSATPMK